MDRRIITACLAFISLLGLYFSERSVIGNNNTLHLNHEEEYEDVLRQLSSEIELVTNDNSNSKDDDEKIVQLQQSLAHISSLLSDVTTSTSDSNNEKEVIISKSLELIKRVKSLISKQQQKKKLRGNIIGNSDNQSSSPLPIIHGHLIAQGSGTQFINNVSNQNYNLLDYGIVSQWNELGSPSWYNILRTSKLTWNMSPYKYDNCAEGENMFNMNNGFTFHSTDDDDDDGDDGQEDEGDVTTTMRKKTSSWNVLKRKNTKKSKTQYLQFRLNRRDVRSCLFNGSKTCLSGGNFIMNLGKTAPDMYHPGSYNIGKVEKEMIKVTAYNTIRDCSSNGSNDGNANDAASYTQVERRSVMTADDEQQQQSSSNEKHPIDYLKQDLAFATNPSNCQEWITEREQHQDIFHFNSDQSTIHVDTPSIYIRIDVRQNKVPTDEECNYANMNVWITTATTEMVPLGGILGGGGANTEVDGPFSTEHIARDY